LEVQKIAEEERSASDRVDRQQHVYSYIRSISKRGMYNTITFSDVEVVPTVFTHQVQPVVPNTICVITGLPAKYKDPKSGMPYANLAAYAEIKRKYHTQ
jgi:vacuolar protein sorting-associated protein 72